MVVSTVILAAGQGTRMRSSLPKVLHCLAGLPFIEYSLRAAASLGDTLPVVVIGHGADAVRATVGERARFALQVRQLGTAHAVMTAEPLLSGQSDLVVVISADMPLLTAETLRRMVEIQTANPGPFTMLTINSKDSHGFGRVLRGSDGSVRAVMEEAHASSEQLAVEELNAGVYCFSAKWLWPALHRIKLSPKGEYYLTDTVELAVKKGLRVEALKLSDPSEAIGINTRVHLAEAEELLHKRINRTWMLAGVTIIDPNATYIGPDVKIGQDAVIYPGTHLYGSTTIGPGSLVGPNAMIVDSRVGCACKITFSVLEGAVVEDEVEIGPFCHLSPGTHLATNVHLGNFVEVRDSYLSPGVKVEHFAFLSSATVGENATIGAGAVVKNKVASGTVVVGMPVRPVSSLKGSD
jgi:bifunctional UDP-N-acetylglucosamine pyrophosphorylase/glucosamine-1-phosphate N-acetyltransferase